MTGLVFVDVETTGLNPYQHEVWEIAVIERRIIHHAEQPDQLVDTEHLFYLRPDLSKADPAALTIGRFYERTTHLEDAFQRPYAHGVKTWDQPSAVARHLARLFDGKHLVGAVPSFDAMFLARLLFKQGQMATWHYHLIDVQALAVGYLAGLAHAQELLPPVVPPYSGEDLGRRLGVTVDPAARHTAMGDAHWARDMYDAVISDDNRSPSQADLS